MSHTLHYVIADPSGNITILVLDPVERKDYAETAKKLLARHEEAEQVGFMRFDGEVPRVEMSGLEFCGNAARAFAYYLTEKEGAGKGEKTVSVSGCGSVLTARADISEGWAESEVPKPVELREVTVGDRQGTLVVMEGISHLFLIGAEPSEETFRSCREALYEKGEEPAAFGVMFLSEDRQFLTPVVWVRDVDTLYFEGSCASGSAAAACAMALSEDLTGEAFYTFREPAGTLSVRVAAENGVPHTLALGGSMALGEVQSIEV